MRPITRNVPKGLVKVGGKPLLQWVVEWLKLNGVTSIVMGVAYLKEKIIEYFGNGRQFGVDISYSVHSVEGGTAEGFRLAITRYVDDQTFYALNGDQITDIRLSSLLSKHRRSEATATIAVVHPRLPFGLVEVDKRGYCSEFLEKPILTDRYISTGVYIFEKTIARQLPHRGDIERTTFPRLSTARKLGAYRHTGSFITVNSLRELDEAEERLRKNES